MLQFLIGAMIGGFVGIFVMAALSLASREDERMKQK